MPMSNVLFKSATELAGLVRSKEVSATELVTAALERIEALQPTLNAFLHVDAEGALTAAEQITADDPRPFAGVPIAMKDTTIVAGMPYTMASDMFGDFVPAHDSYVTRRVRDEARPRWPSVLRRCSMSSGPIGKRRAAGARARFSATMASR